jgi:hypothetical protein
MDRVSYLRGKKTFSEGDGEIACGFRILQAYLVKTAPVEGSYSMYLKASQPVRSQPTGLMAVPPRACLAGSATPIFLLWL